MAAWHAVAKVGALKPGDVIAIEAGGVQMVLGLDGDRYFALQRQCLHRGGDLSDGIVARGHVVCANHGWRFSTSTGRHDQASDVCLLVYAVRVNGEDIEVDPIPRTLRGH
ncbi:MAG TPA: Rieske 2Fe-2S domain-containing protein [Kofleriaceae bacterium]